MQDFSQAKQSAEIHLKAGRKLIADASRAINQIQADAENNNKNFYATDAYLRATAIMERGIKFEREALKELQRIDRLSRHDGSTSPY